MKSTAWKKDYLVVMHSDFDNTWTDKTIPCTFMQAIRYVRARNWTHAMDKGTVRIVTLAEFAALSAKPELTIEQVNKQLLEACYEATALFDNYPQCYESIGTHQVLHKAIAAALRFLNKEVKA